jgi:acyl-CoA reductase-like NAD-dependent aldehyde dehydrogenase
MTTTETPTLGVFTGGEHVVPGGAELYRIVDPSTEEISANVVRADAAAVDDAVASAFDAQREWARLSPGRRGELIWAWTDEFLSRAEDIAVADTTNMGKVLKDARMDAEKAAKFARYWAGMADKLVGEQIPSTPGYLSYTVREPLGVVGVVLPWNAPAIMFVARVALALACGNSVVMKPSELTPASALLLARCAVVAGIPSGVVNVVPGDSTTGQALVVHPKVKGVNFTGSVASGRRVATAAAPFFKTVVLELGGKAANIVFPDADLDDAVLGSTWGVFQNAGQTCCAATRLLVHRSVAREFVDRLCALVSHVRVGHPADPTSHIGPLASRAQRDRVLEYVGTVASDGGRVLAGGGPPEDPRLSRGFYFSPTVVGGLDPDAKVAQEEIFGPVLTILEFDDEGEAIAVANGTDYGLTANVWTTNVRTMLRMADALDCGVIWGNSAMLMDPALAFGGTKDSGLGRAAGREAIDGMTTVKRVSVRYQPDAPIPAWPDVIG